MLAGRGREVAGGHLERPVADGEQAIAGLDRLAYMRFAWLTNVDAEIYGNVSSITDLAVLITAIGTCIFSASPMSSDATPNRSASASTRIAAEPDYSSSTGWSYFAGVSMTTPPATAAEAPGSPCDATIRRPQRSSSGQDHHVRSCLA